MRRTTNYLYFAVLMQTGNVMENKAIYFIHSPSPLLGRSPLQRGFFPYALTDKYIKALQGELDKRDFGWKVFADDTESNVEVLIARTPALLVCAPGLRFLFSHRGFDADKIVWLNMIEFTSANPKPVIKRLLELNAAFRS